MDCSASASKFDSYTAHFIYSFELALFKDPFPYSSFCRIIPWRGTRCIRSCFWRAFSSPTQELLDKSRDFDDDGTSNSTEENESFADEFSGSTIRKRPSGMYKLRRASVADLPAIYELQNIPQREFILTSHLLSYPEFIQRAETEMDSNREFYCLLEVSEVPKGFLWISKPDETCEIWGRHLHTLFYACAWFAFEKLQMQRLNWNVRISNHRMIAVCDRFRIRKTGEDFLFSAGETFDRIITGPVIYYQFEAEEYYERIPLMQKYSISKNSFSGWTAVH
jgi:hypothetical protein